jgi:GNAT superfamily N-acetyltransferase
MIVDVVQESQPSVAVYASIPIVFEVREVMRIADERAATRRYRLTPEPVSAPWIKDYDAVDPPTEWPARFDISRWTFFAALADGRRVGGAAVVFRAPGIEMLRGRADVAILWDIRVVPIARGQGVGRALMAAVETWASNHGARWLEVETQDINAPACRFYERCGFELRSVNRTAYPELPDETQLLWQKRLST